MPWLDLLAEYNLDLGGVFLLDEGEDRGVHRIEHLGGIRADIIEVELQRVQSGHTSRRELLPSEFRSESHDFRDS